MAQRFFEERKIRKLTETGLRRTMLGTLSIEVVHELVGGKKKIVVKNADRDI